MKWRVIVSALIYLVGVAVLYFSKMHFDRRIDRVIVPILIMHGEADPAISIYLGKRLFAFAKGKKPFVRFPGGGHDHLDDFGAIETARQFIGGLKS